MLSSSRIIVFLVVVLAIAANSWSRLMMRAGGVHRWVESRQIGWPCPIWGYGVEYRADYGNPMFSQATVYHWKISPPRELILYGSLWLYNAIHFGGLFFTLVWWSAFGWLLWSVSHRERWQFTMRQLLLLPLLVASAFVLPSIFRQVVAHLFSALIAVPAVAILSRLTYEEACRDEQISGEVLAMVDRPTISVVIPLPDDRGHALDCLTAFARQMLNVSFEIIVATDAESADEIAWLVEHLPQVRWLYEPGLRMNALYNVGASVAQGEYLYISESHCIPRSDCLQKIYDFVQEADLAVACSSSDGINGNHIARCEQRLFEEDFHCWINVKKCKVAIRGTLIERKLWERIGGFQEQFGHFSELLIGRQLEAAGVQVGHAEKSWVSHGNQVSLEPLSEELIEYGEDEFRSCDLLPAELRIANSREWTEREWLRDNPTWLSFRQSKEAVRQWCRAFAINYVPMSEERRFQLFRRYWQGAIRQGRLKYLASMQSKPQASEEVSTSPVVYQKAA